MRSIVVKYGLLSGAILGAFMFGSVPFHEQIGTGVLGMVVGYTGMVLAFLMVHAGMKTYRDTLGDGQVSYGQALMVGLLIMLIGSVIYVLCWEVVSGLFFPDFAEKYGAAAIAQARASGQSPADIAKLTADMQAFVEMYKKPLNRMGMTLLEPLPVGLLYSFVSAWLVSRTRGPAPTRMATA